MRGLDAFSLESQFSLTINLVYKPRRDTTVHAGFARYPNLELPGDLPRHQQYIRGDQIFAGTSRAPGIASGSNLGSAARNRLLLGRRLHPEIMPDLVCGEDNYFRINNRSTITSSGRMPCTNGCLRESARCKKVLLY